VAGPLHRTRGARHLLHALRDSILILLTVAWWRRLPLSFRQRYKHGTEVVLIIPVVIIGALVSFWLGGVIESTMLSGDYQNWANRVLA